MKEEYKRLVEEIRDAYFLLQDERIVIVNSKMGAVYGYGKDDLIGKPFIDLIAPKERERILEFCRKRPGGQIGPEARYETWIVTKDGTNVPVELSVWLTRYKGRPAIAGIVVDITKKRKRDIEHIRTKEDERKRLARALHDDTIQELLLITHRLKDIGAGTYGWLPKAAEQRLEEAQGFVERVIDEVRRFVQDLRPDILDDMGLVPSLRWLADRFKDGQGVHVEVHVIGGERRLSPDAELALFRIVQEAMSNVRKHAGASVARVTLEFGDHKVALSVSDNGKGFESPVTASHFASQGKLGLAGMSERVQLFDSSRFAVESAHGKGTIVKVEIAA